MFSEKEKSLIYETACGVDKEKVYQIYLDKLKLRSQMEGESLLYFSFLSELFNSTPDLYYRHSLRQRVIEKHQQ